MVVFLVRSRSLGYKTGLNTESSSLVVYAVFSYTGDPPANFEQPNHYAAAFVNNLEKQLVLRPGDKRQQPSPSAAPTQLGNVTCSCYLNFMSSAGQEERR